MFDTFTQSGEVRRIRRCRRFGIPALEQQSAQMKPILILADQLTHIFATGPEAAAGDLFVDERLEPIGEGDVHRAHVRMVEALANFGKPGASAHFVEIVRIDDDIKRAFLHRHVRAIALVGAHLRERMATAKQPEQVIRQELAQLQQANEASAAAD